MTDAIRVVVVDDSPIVCRLLTTYLQAGRDIQVVGQALNGPRALELVRSLRPHVLTLDLEMPGMSGLQVLEQVMELSPTPVIVVSGVSRGAAAVALQAIDLGAVDFVLKYTPGTDTDPETLRGELVGKVRLASRIKVIRSLRTRPGSRKARSGEGGREEKAGNRGGTRSTARPGAHTSLALPQVVVVGASTGGPLALRELLGRIPSNFPSALLVVQHMPATFTRVLAAQLDRQIELEVREAQEGDRLRPGLVLVAPGDHHLLVRLDGTVEIVQGPKIGGYRPSIDVTMQSVAQVYGYRARGVVLTGMGSDGTLGLVAIRAKGGRTYAQEAATCVIASMPQNAVHQGVVDHVAAPAELARLLVHPVAKASGSLGCAEEV